ncbi:MAG: sugar ABC transporter substrate-binding protein [Christensenellales bacterium]
MKRIFIAMSATLLLLIILSVMLFVDENNTVNSGASSPGYYIQIITQSANTYFTKMLKTGAGAMGEELDVYVEFVNIGYRDSEELVAIEQAIYAKVDGIALQAADITKTSDLIKKAEDAGIAVILYENDMFFIPEVASVGSNSYEIGMLAGQMGIEVTDGYAKTVVILNAANNDDESLYKNLKVQGILDVFSNYPNMKIDGIYALDSGMFEVERLTGRILDDHPDVSLIICADERSTPGVAQVLVDAGRVTDVDVVGYGAMLQTLNYIERGVICGSICPDAEAVGSAIVKQLYAKIKGNNISDYYNTQIFAVRAENVNDFRLEPNGK